MESGVSVIIPVYNREKYIEECIQSVLSQECDFPIEIVVADDGSTDRSEEIVKSFGPPVVFVEKPKDCADQGCGTTRNRAIEASQYPYIAFLDSDDLYLPGHLQRLYDALQENPDIVMAIDQLYYMTEDSSKKWPLVYPDQGEVFLKHYFVSCYFQSNVVMLRRSVFDQLGPFQKIMPLSEDWDLFLKVLEKHAVSIVPGDGAALRQHPDRSVRNVYAMVASSHITLQHAISRYPYPKSWIRKSKAVFQYKLAIADIQERKYALAFFRLCRVFCLDPVRVLKSVIRRKID